MASTTKTNQQILVNMGKINTEKSTRTWNPQITTTPRRVHGRLQQHLTDMAHLLNIQPSIPTKQKH